MRFDIRYHTKFTYDAPVSESHNELRACPVTDAAPAARDLPGRAWPRRPGRCRSPTTGAPASTCSACDSPTGSSRWSPRPPSRRARAGSSSRTRRSTTSPTSTSSPATTSTSRPTRHTEWDDELLKLATDCVRRDRARHDRGGVRHPRPRARVREVRDGGHRHRHPGRRGVHLGGAGVCQDFAHLAVALCRSVGMPARYVSGYLFSADDATAERTDKPVVHVQTHAWIEVAVPDVGWFPLDPTNGREVGELHVKVGHGRDYDDVCPFRGVHHGVAERRARGGGGDPQGRADAARRPVHHHGLVERHPGIAAAGDPRRPGARSRCPRSNRSSSNNSNSSEPTAAIGEHLTTACGLPCAHEGHPARARAHHPAPGHRRRCGAAPLRTGPGDADDDLDDRVLLHGGDQAATWRQARRRSARTCA